MPRSQKTELFKTYDNFLVRALTWLNKEGHIVRPTETRIKIANDDQNNYIIETTNILHFKSWFQYPGSKKRIDILAFVRETISPKPLPACVCSNVYVTYFDIDDNKERAYAIESFRYEAKVPPQEQHAICHAHVVNKSLSEKSCPESFRYKPNDERIKGRFQKARIPTAYVNLPGLLYILTADHLPNNKWKEFIKHCTSKSKGFPSLANCNIINNIMSEKSIMACHWYDQTPT